ncbi:MAG: hydantoinase B/oxoprolinase family protein [Chloroflexota bacterium]|nr:MAG: hydantoinase B/oxoprolinase family protein [Chloroflexota bacterium]
MAFVGEFDPAKAEIYSTVFRGITDEMVSVLLKTAGSPVISEANDFSTCITDLKPECVVMCYAVMGFMHGHLLGIKKVMEDYKDEIFPGDAWLANDTFTAGTWHPADVNIIRPIFYKDELIGFALTEGHVIDIGGSVPGGWHPGARDCYAEAIRFPATKIVDRGVWKKDMLRLLETNVRIPSWVIGDMRAMYASCVVAERRICDLIDRYGMDEYLKYKEVVKDLSELALRKRIERLPDGEYNAIEWIEDNGHVDKLFRVVSKMTVSGSDLTFDLRGSDPQTDGIINGLIQTTLGLGIHAPLMNLLAWDLPPNSGILRPIKLITEKGSIVDCVPPAPTSSAHADNGHKINKMTHRQMSTAMAQSRDPEFMRRVSGAYQNTWPIATFAAPQDQNGRYAVFGNMDAGGAGAGASLGLDGLHLGTPLCSLYMGIPDVEMQELMYPVTYLWRKIYKDSGGPGTYRGGPGIDVAWTPSVSDMVGTVANQATHVPTYGAAGGYPSACCPQHIIENVDVLQQMQRTGKCIATPEEIEGAEPRTLRNKQTGIPLKVGEVLHQTVGGGGGVGDPLLRDPERVEKDVQEDWISVEAAERAYGVIVDPQTLQLDVQATQRKRQEIRERRKKGEGDVI